jgi:membrane-bound serine protease (ClpP class)
LRYRFVPMANYLAEMRLGPNTAFCFLIFGLLGVYCEFIWPGRVLPGIAGAAAAVTGGYFLFRASPTALGLELLGLAVVLVLLDAFCATNFVAGIAATAALTFGFTRLIAASHGIRPILAVPWCVAFGTITMFLNSATRRARRNKRADLLAGQ